MTHAKPGVNVVGFVGGERGQGASVRLGLEGIVRRVASSLEEAAIPFATVPYRPSSSPSHASGFPLDRAVYDTNLVCLNADYLGHLLADAGPGFFAERASIGFWFWETSRFRLDPRTPLACLDEVWVASSYVRDAVAPEVDLPVFVAPLPVDVQQTPTASRLELQLPEGYMFLFAFNFVSSVRKNPMAILEAFTRAFAPGEGPVLVLKSVNGRERKPRLLAELEQAAQERPDVFVIDRYVSEEKSKAILASCDCYVSLHRSEGLGLTMAEAMAFGKPVIATAYSGNLEFMDEANSYLVPYARADVPRSWWAYTPGATWAEPDVGAAAALMRRVWENRDEASALGERARHELLARFSPRRAAEFVEHRLEEVRARTALGSRGTRRDARPPLLEASQALGKDTGASLAQSGAGASSLMRRFLRRAFWPYLEAQQRVDLSMLHAMTSLQRSVEDLEQRVRRLEDLGGNERPRVRR